MSATVTVKGIELNEEQQNIRNLIRVVGSFVAWPALSISLVFFFDLDEHFLHVAGLLPLGLAGLAAVVMAPKLAARFAQEE